jgi:hypothetical protein
LLWGTYLKNRQKGGIFAIAAACWMVSSQVIGASWLCQFAELASELDQHRDAAIGVEHPVGISNVYWNGRHSKVTIFHPTSSPGKTEQLDLVKLDYGPMPERFVLGDGSLNRAFIGVDSRPGTKLSLVLDGVVELINQTKIVKAESRVFDFVQRFEELVAFRWREGVDGKGDNKWDPNGVSWKSEADAKFAEAFNLPVGKGTVPVGREFPVISFEKFFLESCSSYCIQRSLFTKLVLDRINIKSKIVTGSLIYFNKDGSFGNKGHTWVEFEGSDGHTWVLDASTKHLERKGMAHQKEADWFLFYGGYRVPNQSFPLVKYLSK